MFENGKINIVTFPFIDEYRRYINLAYAEKANTTGQTRMAAQP